MKSDYNYSDFDYYLIGCHDRGAAPLSRWRFEVVYGKYQREYALTPPAGFNHLPIRKRLRLLVRWAWLHDLAELVWHGWNVAHQVSDQDADDDAPGSAGAGVREPPPLAPVLVGCAARPLPDPNRRDEAFWWRR